MQPFGEYAKRCNDAQLLSFQYCKYIVMYNSMCYNTGDSIACNMDNGRTIQIQWCLRGSRRRVTGAVARCHTYARVHGGDWGTLALASLVNNTGVGHGL